MNIEFFIPFLVKPKQTKENVSAVTRTGKRYVGRKTPEKVQANADGIAALVWPHRPHIELPGPLQLDVLFQYPWRAHESKVWRKRGARYKDTWPDYDNLSKQFLDVLERVRFFANDSQVADAHIRKVWTDVPGVYVGLEQIPPDRAIIGVHR